jgi:PAS domain S-box-containing protein
METNHINSVCSIEAQRILRKQAEEIVNGQVSTVMASLKTISADVALELMLGLQVHQIELEIQNEELKKSKAQLEESLERYFELYDLAPISYCTVSKEGVILEANFATAELLGESRRALIGQSISNYITKEFQDTYYLCRKHLYATGDQQGCELLLIKPNGEEHWGYLTIDADQNNKGDTVQRMILTDITEAKIMSLTMRESDSKLPPAPGI